MSTQQMPSERPPEEGFWKRFSPHHELPLSTASSIVLHMVFVLLIALFGAAVLSNDSKPGPVVMGPPLKVIPVPGGGGNPDGNSLRPFAPFDLREAALDAPISKELPGPEVTPLDPVSPIRPTTAAKQPLPSSGLKKGESAFSKHNNKSGSMGGSISGLHGKGDGWGTDPNPPTVDTTKARMKRWTLHFEYSSGDDYVFQLKSLGAMVAVPYREGRFRLYRDLGKRPAIFELVQEKDLEKLNRINWVNEDPEAARLLAFALGIDSVPDQFWAFFPQELQDDLAAKEKAAAGGKDISQIKQTLFKVTRRGKTCQVHVIGQELVR